MSFILTLDFLFFIGSSLGWVLELFFRRFISKANKERKWINPGFLVGPYLPLYGFGLCILFLLASAETVLPIGNGVVKKIVLFALMAVAMTLIEYIAGEVFIVGMKVKLWDYSGEWGNIKGIICPKFSFYWAILGAAYYFLIHPYVLHALEWLSRNLAFSFFIGLFFGVFFIDLVYSTQLLVKIRKIAEEYRVVVKVEEFKEHLRAFRERQEKKRRFVFAFHSDAPLGDHLRQYIELMTALKKKPGNGASPADGKNSDSGDSTSAS